MLGQSALPWAFIIHLVIWSWYAFHRWIPGVCYQVAFKSKACINADSWIEMASLNGFSFQNAAISSGLQFFQVVLSTETKEARMSCWSVIFYLTLWEYQQVLRATSEKEYSICRNNGCSCQAIVNRIYFVTAFKGEQKSSICHWFWIRKSQFWVTKMWDITHT